MGSPSRYWRLVKVGAAGGRRVEEVSPAKTFFQQQFTPLLESPDVPDAVIQRQLLELQAGSPSDASTRQLAECCLRCFISHQIEQVCVQLEMQFGTRHGFTRYDLFPFVLDDEDILRPRRSPSPTSTVYRSLATEVLETYSSEKGSLSSWTIRLVRHHKEINAFLLERGVYLISDWAILNDTNPKQLQRIFTEFHPLTDMEIQRACALLEGYHAVYRRDRLMQRQGSGRGQCLPPNIDQLHRIREFLRTRDLPAASPDGIRSQLQALAEHLRRYRIHARGGKLTTESLDQPEISVAVAQVQSQSQEDDGQTEQDEFLSFYRGQMLECLDLALERVTGDRVSYLSRKSAETAQQFVHALQLFHCKGQSMGDIAAQVGLQAQYQVTRLLKLKEFRADVRQHLLGTLRDRILDKAKDYADPKQLQALDQTIETALDEQISTVIQQAESEASIAKNRPLGSLFARRLCRHLDDRRP